MPGGRSESLVVDQEERTKTRTEKKSVVGAGTPASQSSGGRGEVLYSVQVSLAASFCTLSLDVRNIFIL